MKIYFLSNNLDVKTGTGRFSSGLIDNLKFRLPSAELKVLTTVPSGHSLELPVIPADKIKLLFSLLKIRRILKEADIVHSLDSYPYGLIATLACIGLKKKMIITAIGSGSVQPLQSFVSRNILRWVYFHTRVVAISSYVVREMKKKISYLNIDVINPGIDYDYLTKKYPVDGEPKIIGPYILSVGRIKSRKGYEESLRVFYEITKFRPDLKYVIVGWGKGEYRKKIDSLISELGIRDKVIFKKCIYSHSP